MHARWNCQTAFAIAGSQPGQIRTGGSGCCVKDFVESASTNVSAGNVIFVASIQDHGVPAMSSASSSLSSSMFEKYGPLVSLAQLAEILHRTPDGLRMSLHEPSPYAGRLNAAKVRIGRRVYFRTPDLALIFLGEQDDG